MKLARKFLTYKQQIERLTVDRGLVIEDIDYAESVLKKIPVSDLEDVINNC